MLHNVGVGYYQGLKLPVITINRDALTMKNKIVSFFWIYFLFLFFVLFLFPTYAISKSNNYAYEQIWHHGNVYAKVITFQKKCPVIYIDNKAYPMQTHVLPMDKEHPNHICIKLLPKVAHSIHVDGISLPALPIHLQRFVVIGDTGCSLQGGDGLQQCSNIDAWPFKRIIKVAKSYKPQLVVHLGDIIYSKTKCPNPKICGGYPYGLGWPVWKTYYYDPIKPILNKVIWLNLRGNHDNCAAIGMNWFRYFDLDPYPDHCLNHTPIYDIKWPSKNWVIIDNSLGQSPPLASEVIYYKKILTNKYKELKQPNWIFSHFPFYSFLATKNTRRAILEETASSFKAAVKKTPFNPSTQLVISGHDHSFQHITLDNKNSPTQFIAGNGGVFLMPYPGIINIKNQEIYAGKISNGAYMYHFGFLLFEKHKNIWHMSAIDSYNHVMYSCDIRGKKVKCYDK